MRVFYSYARLLIACCLFMGGLALQFVPSTEATARENRRREKHLKAIPADKEEQWIEEQDANDARSYANLRLFGVLLGGLGLAGALHETAYLIGSYGRLS